MTEKEIKAIEARALAATPGPWSPCDSGETGEPVNDNFAISWEGERADVVFIAAARTDVPALIAALREANAKIAAYES